MSSIYDELSQQDSKALVEMDGGINLAGDIHCQIIVSLLIYGSRSQVENC